MNWLRAYVPETRAGRIFALSAFVDASGTGLYLAGSAIFFVRVVGLTSTQVGLGLTLGMTVGFLSTVPMGLLGQRIGAKRLLVLLQLARGAGLIALAFCTSFPWFLALSAYLAVAQSATGPMTQAVIGAATGEKERVRTMAVVRSTRNLGFSLGALSVVPLLAAHSPWAYRSIVLGNALSFALAAVVVMRLALPAAPRVERTGSRIGLLAHFRDFRYLSMTGLNGVLVLHSTLLSVGIPLSVVQASRAPDGLVPLLTLTNTVMAVVLQVHFARRATAFSGSVRALRYGGLSLAGCCLAMGLTQHTDRWTAIALLFAAIVLLSLGELWQSAGSWEVSYRYAPQDQRPTYLSIFFLGITAESIFGPLVVTGLVVGHGPFAWLCLAAVLGLAAALVRPVLTPLERRLTAPQGERPLAHN
ncbi:MFS transporter [Streptomyces sp. NPDC001455]|uniref:MFS transporter n=1 Tax=unclassified Streptomyces TaxID=2593676 RepID=UPI003326B458